MRPLKVGAKENDTVLVAKFEDNIYSIGNYCSHFGAPLHTGAIVGDRVFCPWHSASFNLKSGAIEGGPALDGVPQYNIISKNGKSFVQVPEVLTQTKSQQLAKRDLNDQRHFIVIGGGPAGLNCAEALRQSGFTGQISLVSADSVAPYDRTSLSKAVATGDVSQMKLRSEEYLQNDAQINLILGTRAERIIAKDNLVQLSNNQTLRYDKLCLAVGTSAVLPKIKGINLKNVHALRDHYHQAAIRDQAAKSKNIVILGGGFIGSECASALKLQFGDKVNVHLVHGDRVPMERQFGFEVGKVILQDHKQAGVQLHMQKLVTEIGGTGDSVQHVILNDGTKLEADLVIVGAGVTPSTQFLKDSGIQLNESGALVCNNKLQTNIDDIFAAGDAVSYQTGDNSHIRIEHYITSQDQGSNAAFNMLGQSQVFNRVPFFWTRNYNKSIQYVGYAQSYDEVFIQGDPLMQQL
ncbi:nad-dependent dehydrogenase [Stylonychia lemnae]|uniref:Nad-dependent dehydrogenase n=1 Tax=Stylonychia lemnae TaxID=5949 RepID=A0A078AY67_STYLE|nr:nad-dependent dehydrogenase [Stylonychia lemnae]|eukprot:CDW87365.1 nad-dependent dehydrogenase [Stylonychia lemnae]